MYKDKILIVEDEHENSNRLHQYLQDSGFEVVTAANCFAAERMWRSLRPDLAVIDCDLRDAAATTLIMRLRSLDRSIPIITLASYGSLETGIETVRLGAEQFMTKPVDVSTLRVVIGRSLENERNRRTRLAENSLRTRQVLDPFLGKSDLMKRLRDSAQRVSLSDSPVLIEGETGTGKGELARWFHQNGPRAAEPFVILNCSGFPASQVEPELFGDERSMAHPNRNSKLALVEIAHRGTLFLDSVGELPHAAQLKLSRFLDEHLESKPSPGAREHRVDLRLIAATHQAMARLVQSRHFRAELYFRLRTVSVAVPPLREHPEDIPAIANHLLLNLGADLGAGPFELTRSALAALQCYSWPGNVRELRTVLERALLVACDSVLTERDLSFEVVSHPSSEQGGRLRTLEEMERYYIHQILRKEGGHVETAAKRLGIPRSSLYHKLKQYREEEMGLRNVS